MSTRIRIRAIEKEFKARGERTRAVAGVDLDIEPGELFFLLGPSGCGKTTLLRMLAGFIEPTNGAIHFDEREVTHAPPNTRNTGMVFQSYALWPHMTVKDNVAFGLGVRKVPAADRNTRVNDALKSVQMLEYADRKPTQLSGGQQQRVALARALVIEPAVLLLDEPLSNLDAKLRADLRTEIRRLCKASGSTTVYVTHDQKEALSMADRIAIMREGRVVQIGTPEDLYRRPRTRFVASFLGETNFLDATIEGREGELVRLQSPAGDLVARVPQDRTIPERGGVVCSIRPEAVKLIPKTEGSLKADFHSSVYYGEVMQHVLDLPGGGTMKCAEINPRNARVEPGTVTGWSVAPEDVVLLED